MKICFFAHNTKTHKNGAAQSLIDTANELANRGFDVIIILPNKKLRYPINNNKIKCITIPSLSLRTRLDDYSILNKVKEVIKIIYNRFAIRSARKILDKEKIDIIHINGLDSEVGAEVALKLNVPYVWHIRQLLEEDFGMRLHNEKRILNLLKRANAVIAISKTVKEKFERKLNRELSLIYNGIPLDEYIIKERKPFYSNETLKILLAGRIVEQKGQFEAVKAINHLVQFGIKNIHLTIAGNIQDTEYANSIRDYITRNELHDYIQILDHVSNLRQLRKTCDIGLICSKKEAFGRVTIESMASRMLVIGANTGGTAEIIENNVNGLLYQQGDYISLANQIKYAIENKNKMNAIIFNGYKSVIENYSISNVVDIITNIYINIEKEQHFS